ncbi:MAG: TusE/DsrC/DsvC family sulfur relay protein [Pseudomonadota bacterium]
MNETPVIQVDKEGFLRDFRSWTPTAAYELAAQDEITLNEQHWEIITLVRQYYDDYRVSPPTRVLAKLVTEHLGPDKGRSIYLMQLFTARYAKYVSKIAGLPKPTGCD